LLTNILEDISTDNPCGSDYKYEDIFLEVEAEIDKSKNILEDMDTDWDKVSHVTETLLNEHTKDIKILCWWTYSLWKRELWVGLEKTLPVLDALLKKYTSTLFPKSKKVKISSLQWLETQLTEEVLDENGNIFAQIEHENFYTFFNNIEQSFSLAIEEEINLFSKIQKSLKKIIDEKEAKKKESVNQREIVSSPATEADEIVSDSDAAKLLSQMKKSATLLHNYWRKKEAANLGSIRLIRMLAWLETDGLPIHEDKKTPLNPPSQESVEEVEILYAEEKYTEAFEKVETVISFSPFWLDGHYISYNLLTAMGKDAAALEVKNALISYVNADKEILDLTFRDSTPFASIKVKEWLAHNLETLESNIVVDKEQNEREEIIETCYLLAKKKNIKEAMKILQNSYTSASTKEDKFIWRLSHAQLAKEYGKNELALALVEDLRKEIEVYKLDEWNPKLSAKVFKLFLDFNRTQVNVEELQMAYVSLCKIDAEEALEIKI